MTNKEVYEEFKKMLRNEAKNIADEVGRIKPDFEAKQVQGIKSSAGNDRTVYTWVNVKYEDEQIGFINLFLNEIDPETVNPHTQFGKVTFGHCTNRNKHIFPQFQNSKQPNPMLKYKGRAIKAFVRLNFDRYYDSEISIFDDDYSPEMVAKKFIEWLGEDYKQEQFSWIQRGSENFDDDDAKLL